MDVAWNGNSCHLLTEFGTTSGEGTVTVADPTTGVVSKTVVLGPYSNNFPGVIKLSGYGSGDHIASGKLTAGTGFTVDALLIPNPNPPRIIVVKEGPVLVYLAGYTSDVAGGIAKLVGTYEPAIDSLPPNAPPSLTRQRADRSAGTRQ